MSCARLRFIHPLESSLLVASHVDQTRSPLLISMHLGLLFSGLLPLFGVASPALAQEAVAGAPPTITAEGVIDQDTPAAPQNDPRPEPSWAGTVELYGFAPLRTTGTATIQGFETDLDLDLDQVLRPLTSVAYIRGSVEYGRLGLLTDISYVSLKSAQGTLKEIKTRSLEGSNRSLTLTPESQRSLEAKIGSIQGIYDLALRYRFGDRESAVAKPGSFSVIPYAGVRFVDIRYNLALESQGPSRTLTFRGTGGEGTRTLEAWNLQRQQSYGGTGGTVAQPLIGTQAMVFLSPRLRLFARADIGGFGVNNSEDYSWNTQAGLGYAIGNSTQLNLSWRYLHLSGTNGQIPENAYDIDQNGVEVGVKFFF